MTDVQGDQSGFQWFLGILLSGIASILLLFWREVRGRATVHEFEDFKTDMAGALDHIKEEKEHSHDQLGARIDGVETEMSKRLNQQTNELRGEMRSVKDDFRRDLDRLEKSIDLQNRMSEERHKENTTRLMEILQRLPAPAMRGL